MQQDKSMPLEFMDAWTGMCACLSVCQYMYTYKYMYTHKSQLVNSCMYYVVFKDVEVV